MTSTPPPATPPPATPPAAPWRRALTCAALILVILLIIFTLIEAPMPKRVVMGTLALLMMFSLGGITSGLRKDAPRRARPFVIAMIPCTLIIAAAYGHLAWN